MKKTRLTLIIFVTLVILGFLFIGKTDNRLILGIKELVPQSVKNILRDNIFFVFKQKNQIENLSKLNSRLEEENNLLKMSAYKLQKIQNNLLYDSINNSYNLPLTEVLQIKSNDNSKYKLTKYFFPAISWQYNDRKPSGYLFNHEEYLFTVSGEGEIGYLDVNEFKNNSQITLYKIDSNLKELVNDHIIYSKSRYGFRGIMISKNKIFLSYQKKIKENCYNISIISAELNFKNLNFEDFFSFAECSNKMSNHTGGKMIPYNDESFLFTIGDAQAFSSVQDDKSLFGKLIKINYLNKNYKLIAKGMRDSQGGYYYEDKKVLVMTEHGPQGGDEINVLKESEFNDYVNYGWPIASYGKVIYNDIKELKYQNHSKHGFKEPAYWYKKNSIAPSNIINADGFIENSIGDFFLSAMGNTPAPGRRSLHHIKFNDDFSDIVFFNVIPIQERIRDLFYIKKINKIVMILENSPSIAVLEVL